MGSGAEGIACDFGGGLPIGQCRESFVPVEALHAVCPESFVPVSVPSVAGEWWSAG